MSGGGPVSPQHVDNPPKPGVFEQLRLICAPPRDEDVLVADEVVYYRAPKHVMSLAEPVIETVAVLIVVVAALTRPAFDGFNLTALLFFLSIGVLIRFVRARDWGCLLYTSPSPRDKRQSRMPSSA